MQSGIPVTEEVREVFQKLNKSKIKAFLVKIEKEQMMIDKIFEKEGFTYEKFAEGFPETESRFGCILIETLTDDNRPLSKILAFLWSPTAAKPLSKMHHSTSFKTFTGEFTQIAKDVQLDDKAQLTEENLVQKFKK